MSSPTSDLVPLAEAVILLRKAHRPRGLQTLRDRIQRGTLRGVQKGRYWYLYRDDVARLMREHYRSKGGRPCSITPASAAYAVGRLAVDVDEVIRMGTLPLETRVSAMLGAQVLLLGIKRGQVEQKYPRLSARDGVFKMFEELQNGDSLSTPHILRRRPPRTR